jgi:hypothetical protein
VRPIGATKFLALSARQTGKKFESNKRRDLMMWTWLQPDIKMVYQRRAADCAICCIAMATGLDYEHVEDFVPFEEPDDIICGLRFPQIVATMKALDQQVRWHWPEKYNPDDIDARIRVRNRVRNRNGIHLVPSRSWFEADTLHCVLVRDGKVYDPSQWYKFRYTRFEQLKPLGVVYHV